MALFSYENMRHEMKIAPPMNTFDFFWHSIVHRWCCFHMKIWDIKWKIRAIWNLTFLASHEFSKINELSNNHVQTKTHHMKLFLGLNSYHLKISKIDHCDMRGIRIAQGQSFRLLTLLNKKWVFQNCQLLPLAVFMPLEENPFYSTSFESSC